MSVYLHYGTNTWEPGTISDDHAGSITHSLYIEGMVPLTVNVEGLMMPLIHTWRLDGHMSACRQTFTKYLLFRDRLMVFLLLYFPVKSTKLK